MSEENNKEENKPELDPEAAAKAAARAERDKARAERAAERARKKAEEGGESPAASGEGAEDKDAARAARDKARAERAAARAKKLAEEEAAAPKEPSHNQPRLDKAVQLIKENVSSEAIEEAYINEMDAHLPVIVIRGEHWVNTATLLRDHEAFRLNYLRNVSGVDMETHIEVVYHLISFYTQDEYCIKVKTDRDNASVPSVTPIWNTANWNEREIYDLLGVDFPGHPDMRRIMMSDDWIGHPLRKDYEPYDPEV